MTESAFYAHFASKAELYDELFRASGPAVVHRLATSIAADAEPSEALRLLAAEVIDEWSTPRARRFASIVLRDAFSGDAPALGALMEAIDDALAALAARFDAWRKSGRLRDDVDTTALAYAFVSPLVMARFLFFNVTAGEREARRGAQIVARHAAAFVKANVVSGIRRTRW